MKKTLLFFLAIPLLISCEKENNTDDSYFWTPDIRVEKGDGQVNLYLTDPRPYTEYISAPPSNPEFFEIYYSDNRSSFNLFKKAGSSESNITITDLQNNKPYYFYVLTGKSGLQSEISDTLMAIPSHITQAFEMSTEYNFSGTSATLSHDNNLISFVSNNFLFYKGLNDRTITFIDEMTSSPTWSPVANSIAYIIYNNVGLWWYPFRLKLYNTATQTSEILSEADFSKFYINSPVFSKDGRKIGFLSSENNSEKELYDIWTVDINSKAKTRLTNFENSNFVIQGLFEWSVDGSEIYLSGYKKNGTWKRKIYRYNIAEARLTQMLESDWSDISPAVSPDNTRLAFISDRSGDDEIWIFNMVNNEYQMITGSYAYNFDRRYSGIQWISNNEILISAYHENAPEVLRFTVE